MSKFNIGDEVLLDRDDDRPWTVTHIYKRAEVPSIFPEDDVVHIRIEKQDDNGTMTTVSENRCQLDPAFALRRLMAKAAK